MAANDDRNLIQIPHTGAFGGIVDQINTNFDLLHLAILSKRDGKSAYEVWKDQEGNENKSVEEFLASLKESGFDSLAVQTRPTTNIDTKTIYCIPNPLDANEWTEEIFVGTGWIVLARHIGGLSNLIATTPHIESDGESDFSIKDEQDNAIVQFQGGHVKTKNFDSSVAATQSDLSELEQEIREDIPDDSNFPTIGDSDADLSIKDEQDNAIVQFQGGHVKTKNFDSRKIEGSLLFLSKFNGKKIGIIGDSISTYGGWLPSDIDGYNGATYTTFYSQSSPMGGLTNVNMTWWHIMCTQLCIDPQLSLVNCSWSGSKVCGNSTSTISAAVGCSTRRVEDLSAKGFVPDIVLLYIGTNDWGNNPNIPIGNWASHDGIPSDGEISTFREGYVLLIDKIHKEYPRARVFCCTLLDDVSNRDNQEGFPSDNESGVTIVEYNNTICDIAAIMGCDVIDIHSCGINYANMGKRINGTYTRGEYSWDGIHPNANGHKLIARKVVAELFSKY